MNILKKFLRDVVVRDYFKKSWVVFGVKTIALTVSVCLIINIANLPAFSATTTAEEIEKQKQEEKNREAVAYQYNQAYSSIEYMLNLDSNIKLDVAGTIFAKRSDGTYEAIGYWKSDENKAYIKAENGEVVYNEAYTKAVKKQKVESGELPPEVLEEKEEIEIVVPEEEIENIVDTAIEIGENSIRDESFQEIKEESKLEIDSEETISDTKTETAIDESTDKVTIDEESSQDLPQPDVTIEIVGENISDEAVGYAAADNSFDSNAPPSTEFTTDDLANVANPEVVFVPGKPAKSYSFLGVNIFTNIRSYTTLTDEEKKTYEDNIGNLQEKIQTKAEEIAEQANKDYRKLLEDYKSALSGQTREKQALEFLAKETGLTEAQIYAEIAGLDEEQKNAILSVAYTLYISGRSIINCAADALSSILIQTQKGLLAFQAMISDAILGLFAYNNVDILEGKSTQLKISMGALNSILALNGQDYGGFNTSIAELMECLEIGESSIVWVSFGGT
ncbi:MAG: hypothetical protein LBU55_01155, partial [Elusimicrobiota bacterium]|nr:hypothetical protein [Elusimicrobiota bacterium]